MVFVVVEVDMNTIPISKDGSIAGISIEGMNGVQTDHLGWQIVRVGEGVYPRSCCAWWMRDIKLYNNKKEYLR